MSETTKQPVQLGCLTKALEQAGIYPKVINVAKEVDPITNREAYRSARQNYINGWQDCVKQIADNLAANGHATPEREAVDLEKGARAISALRYPHAPAVTPHSRELAEVCAKAWGLKLNEIEDGKGKP